MVSDPEVWVYGVLSVPGGCCRSPGLVRAYSALAIMPRGSDILAGPVGTSAVRARLVDRLVVLVVLRQLGQVQ